MIRAYHSSRLEAWRLDAACVKLININLGVDQFHSKELTREIDFKELYRSFEAHDKID